MGKYSELPEMLQKFCEIQGVENPPQGNSKWKFALISVLHYGRSTRGLRKKLPSGLRSELTDVLGLKNPSVISYHLGIMEHEYRNIHRVKSEMDALYQRVAQLTTNN